MYLYTERDSLLHRLHPVTRILALLLSFVVALAFSHPLYVLFLWLVFLIPCLRAGAWLGVRRVWFLMLAIGLMSFILWGFFYEGQAVVWGCGPVKLTRESLLFGAGMGLRLNMMLFCGLAFLAATRVEDFSAGLHVMGVPYAVSFALSLSFRLVPIFSESARTILQAQRARGLDTESGGPVKRFRTYLPLLVPVFGSALRRTDMLAVALESKGFGAKTRRTNFREFQFQARDIVTLVSLGIMAAGCFVLRFMGFGVI